MVVTEVWGWQEIVIGGGQYAAAADLQFALSE